MSIQITFVSSNEEKVREFVDILGTSLPVSIIAKSLDIPEMQGEISDICINKCLQAAIQIKGPVIVEDTSLCCNALQGLPGPYIKWFYQKLGPEGISKMLAGYSDKTAHAVCTLAFSEGIDQKVKLFQGRTDGFVVTPRGRQNFGWDACFQPLDFSLTYAEMDEKDKNKISHRYKAIEAMRNFLKHKYMQSILLQAD